jgi:hypothetical protein
MRNASEQSWRHQVIRVPYGEGRDPEDALRERLHAMPTYFRLVSVTARGEAWTLIVEDEQAR